jgi:hypothetical protein
METILLLFTLNRMERWAAGAGGAHGGGQFRMILARVTADWLAVTRRQADRVVRRDAFRFQDRASRCRAASDAAAAEASPGRGANQ